MNLNLTLVGQMITFALFVAFTMKYVWPPLMAALDERQKKIADGLAAAERGQNELVLSQQKAKEYLKDAKTQAAKMIETAQQKSDQIIIDAAELARKEADRIVAAGKMEVEKEKHKVKLELQKEASDLIVMALTKILPGQIDAAKNHQLVEQVIREIKESN